MCAKLWFFSAKPFAQAIKNIPAEKGRASTQLFAAGHLPMLSQPARVAASIMGVAHQLEG